MNKNELIEEVSEKAGFTKNDTHKFLNAYIDAVTKHLRKGKEVGLVGFGTFKVAKRKARVGRNPQTGKELKIPAKKVPTFRPGKALKEAVN
ncbi:MAG: HU family DNA-binding protein [Verrucomicrobia bacterium]|nr:HU family DNA-binding protein [Verrucomicrobiota bacterium]